MTEVFTGRCTLCSTEGEGYGRQKIFLCNTCLDDAEGSASKLVEMGLLDE